MEGVKQTTDRTRILDSIADNDPHLIKMTAKEEDRLAIFLMQDLSVVARQGTTAPLTLSTAFSQIET